MYVDAVGDEDKAAQPRERQVEVLMADLFSVYDASDVRPDPIAGGAAKLVKLTAPA